MPRVFFSYTEEDVRPLARELFFKAVKFDFTRDKHHRMLAEAERVLEAGIGGIDVRGYYEIFGPGSYRHNSVRIPARSGGAAQPERAADSLEIRAVAFSRFPDASVRQVIPYIITGGECVCYNEDDIAELLFAHMWGTAYVDAGRLLFERDLKRLIEPLQGVGLSPAFSPGFYGMSHGQSREIAEALGASDIGITVLDSGTMLPIKTVSGVYLVADGSADFPTDECLICIGNRENCSQCMIRNKKIIERRAD
ncbi:MAG: hypothetical protein LBC58_01375 [Clostridiales Family XIII bacterium]|jgi:hypothetical protein|nr:hypothetical protein [Clostridiales Family XIII bacterium]